MLEEKLELGWTTVQESDYGKGETRVVVGEESNRVRCKGWKGWHIFSFCDAKSAGVLVSPGT
jgi:hypothetical protein